MRYIQLTCSCILFLLVFSCKKTSVTSKPVASLNLVNASVNLGAVKAQFTNQQGLYSSNTTSVAYGGFYVYGIPTTGAIPLTIVTTADTTKTVFTSNLSLASGGIYSLYLAGQAGAVDTLFAEDMIPAFSDSSCGVRFINLSYNSNPVTVNLTATPTVAEFSNVAYKQIAAFKTYPALSTNGTYAFQVRDAATSNLLASYTLTTPRFRAVTLILTGVEGGSPALSVLRVNNY